MAIQISVFLDFTSIFYSISMKRLKFSLRKVKTVWMKLFGNYFERFCRISFHHICTLFSSRSSACIYIFHKLSTIFQASHNNSNKCSNLHNELNLAQIYCKNIGFYVVSRVLMFLTFLVFLGICTLKKYFYFYS